MAFAPPSESTATSGSCTDMPGKAKTQKHTAKELKGKAFEATVNRGGGAAGVNDRKVRPVSRAVPSSFEPVHIHSAYCL